jgi:hypothetical protein
MAQEQTFGGTIQRATTSRKESDMTANKDFDGCTFREPKRTITNDKTGEKRPIDWRLRCKHCYSFSREWIADEPQSFGSCENADSPHWKHMVEEGHLSCKEFSFDGEWQPEPEFEE